MSHSADNLTLKRPEPETGKAKAPPVAPAHASAQDVASYIADLTGQLAAMARGSRLTFLAYLLEMAQLEARDTARPEERRIDA